MATDSVSEAFRQMTEYKISFRLGVFKRQFSIIKLILSLNSYFECHTTIYAFFCKISFIFVFFLKGYSFYQATDPEMVFKKFHFISSALSL